MAYKKNSFFIFILKNVMSYEFMTYILYKAVFNFIILKMLQNVP